MIGMAGRLSEKKCDKVEIHNYLKFAVLGKLSGSRFSETRVEVQQEVPELLVGV